ncbi:hypothetical protein SAMN05920897_10865 [Alkalispirochaeta americana]|uniref:Ketoreductase domain-containing protein n=1 Tax=Alkalispirochaeta americana TaxID=159291 RepID=A0A1N6SFV1_9SPIO|nr:SDR family NAD(P)-dependent oxidoreductase [Alkalispirochaeta americana]SIQ39930.1 hypothetical protein SAMN05920897_10865 [Alkalispirochaeta americana]
MTAPGWALITGATSGLGRALARRCALAGWDLVLVARRDAVLQELEREITRELVERCTSRRIRLVCLDLSVPSAVDVLERSLAEQGVDPEEINLLINNAGVGDYGPFQELSRERIEQTIALNVCVVTQAIHRFAPRMKRGSTVCTVASVASFTPGPLMAVYYASKAYALSLSESLREEYRSRGIRFVAVCPGPFQSGFHAAAGIGPAGRLPGADAVAARVMGAIRRGNAVVPVGAGAWVWSMAGPRLPRWAARRIMHLLQRRRS